MSMTRKRFLQTFIGSSISVSLMNKLFFCSKNHKTEFKDKIKLEKPFSFAVVADPHCDEESGAHGWSESGYGSHVYRFLQCVNHMEKVEGKWKPDFMLVLGDIHLWALSNYFNLIHIPMHVIAGNHEYGERKKQMRELFKEDFQINGSPSDYYSFVHGGVRFIGVCNAGLGNDHIGHLCSDDIRPRGQCEWLEEQLKEKEDFKIVFAHIPPQIQGKDVELYMSRNDSRFFNDLMKRTQPLAAFFGHKHRTTRKQRIVRTLICTVRSCAWNKEKAPIGYLLAHIDNNGLQIRDVQMAELKNENIQSFSNNNM